jgi:hypothetical protein
VIDGDSANRYDTLSLLCDVSLKFMSVSNISLSDMSNNRRLP